MQIEHETANGNPGLDRLESRLREAVADFWQSLVDTDDPLYDEQGVRWSVLGADGQPAPGAGWQNESQLRQVRAECRMLAVSNEFAINGHENRVSYIVGPGHAYRAVPRAEHPGTESLAAEVQAVLDEFVRRNHWQRRQQEIVRRKDRDGECFLRLFPAPDGILRVRFVEPDQVQTPPDEAGNPAATLGILTDPDDVETVRAYYVDGRWTDAQEIQHRKANVDANVKRGLPLYYPVRKNLRRAEKLLRNMSVVAEIQSAIALIRKHSVGTRSALQRSVEGEADMRIGRPGATAAHYRRYGPGTILDTLAGVDYEFPAAGIDAGRYVAVLQAELRAIASRLVMPEFMLSSDASNANYASTLVAEGPAMKMFDRLQNEMIAEDLEVMHRVVGAAIDAGRLPAEAATAVEVRGIPPTVAIRDRLRDAQADRILVDCGAMSVATMAMRHGLDPQREQRLMARQTSAAPLP
jgi:capsid protein